MHRYCMFLVQSYITFSLMTGTSTRKQQYSYFVKEWVSFFFGDKLKESVSTGTTFLYYLYMDFTNVILFLEIFLYWNLYIFNLLPVLYVSISCISIMILKIIYINYWHYISVFDGLDFGVLLFFLKFIIKFRLKTSVRKLNSSCSIIKNYIISCTMCGCWVILF